MLGVYVPSFCSNTTSGGTNDHLSLSPLGPVGNSLGPQGFLNAASTSYALLYTSNSLGTNVSVANGTGGTSTHRNVRDKEK